jgi:hypothetical protein
MVVGGGGGGGQPLNLNVGGTIDLGDVGRGIGDGSQPLLFLSTIPMSYLYIPSIPI